MSFSTPSGPPSQPQSQDVTITDTTQPPARTFRETLEVVEDSELFFPQCYPVRQRTQPERFGLLLPIRNSRRTLRRGSSVTE